MKADPFIESLVEDLRPAPPRQASLRIVLALVGGAAAALALVMLWLRLRSDLDVAVASPNFWIKALYAGALAGAGAICVERLARPVASPRGGLLLGGVALVVLVALSSAQLAGVPPAHRMGLLLGRSWQSCPSNILILSVPTLALTLLTMRSLAPTRLRLAGAAAGLLAGGVAASAYALHCPETAPAFVVTWYSLGVLASMLTGLVVGPWALRWR